ncbi:MAG: cation diffusion facilitator family transporter [Desulfovibrio sp.]|jgi:cation diffusion facilitator family transporter|nr:cation diffusion facilitator family transporter [Desulfovibrio sp.]
MSESAANRERYGMLVSLTGLVCNLALFCVKLLMGFAANSAAVISDAFNNLADSASSLTLLAGFSAAGKDADAEHPFGHGRMEYIAALVAAALILSTALGLGKFSLDRILAPEPVHAGPLVIVGLFASIALKLLLYLFYKRANKKLISAAVSAGAADSLADVAVTGVTLFSILVSSHVTFPLDAPVGMAIAVFIFITGLRAAKDALDLLLGKREDAGLEQRIRDLILSTDGIRGIHRLTVHDYGPSRKYASAHIELAPSMNFAEVHAATQRATARVRAALAIDLVLFPEPCVSVDEEKT